MNLPGQPISLFLFLLLFITTNAQKNDRYTLSYTAGQPAVVSVAANITLEDPVLYMSTNGPAPERFPAYVHNLEVTDANGQSLDVEFRDSVQWVIQGVSPGDQVRLTYRLSVDHEQESWPGGTDGVAYQRAYGTMTSGRSLFIMNGRDKQDILVTPGLPDTWKVSVPWAALPEKPGTYKAANLEDLQESFIFAGTHQEIVVNRKDFTLKFVLGGDNLYSQKPQITTMANSLLDYYIDLMGGLPNPGPGATLEQSMVIITENETTDGEVIGNHISMFMNPAGDQQSRLIGWFIFAHEFYHLWNGKSIKFRGTQSDWFKEGISNYYTLKGLRNVGFLNEEAYTAVLNNLFYQRYINDPGLGKMSPVSSAEGFSKDRHWGLIYGGGLFAGIAMDMEIRQNSANEKSLDDLMKALYTKSAGTEMAFTNDDLISEVQLFGFEGFPAFFEKHLNGTDVISLSPYLSHAGVKVSENDGQLRLDQNPEKSKMEGAIWEGFLGGR